MLSAEKTGSLWRSNQCGGSQEALAWLERELKTADTDLREAVRERRLAREGRSAPSVTGVGRITSLNSWQIARAWPLEPQQIAALAGVAPMARDSGTLKAGDPFTAAALRCAQRSTWPRSSLHTRIQ